jgi:hypothetical protein
MKASSLTLLLPILVAGCGNEEPRAQGAVPAEAARSIDSKTVGTIEHPRQPIPLSAPPRDVPHLKRLIPVRMGEYVEWTYKKQRKPVGYRMGHMTVIIRGPAEPPLGSPNLLGLEAITRQIRIQAPGRPEYVDENESIGAGFPTRLGYGRLDRLGPFFVLAQTFTGGAHCCGEIELFILHPNRVEHVDLQVAEDGFDQPDVRDVDGDGMVDFIVSDQAFINHFTSWVEGRVPPRILNVIDGEVQNVSARPGFRSLFVQAARELRQECLHPDRISPNGACAAYVAAAGRAGDFATAWREMLTAYDRKNNDGLEIGCRIPIPAGHFCPSDQKIYQNYPDALRAFLRGRGYPTH